VKDRAIAVMLAAALVSATAATAYESKDIEDIERTTPGQAEGSATTKAPEGGYAPGEPSGSPTQDEWRKNEVPVLLTARIVDGDRGYPLDRARVILKRDGGPPHEVARTDVTGGVHARYLLHDPAPKIAGGGVSTQVVVRVERPGYLPYEGTFGPGSLPRKGRYAWIDLGDLRMRPVPIEPEAR